MRLRFVTCDFLFYRLEDANVVEWKHINWKEIAEDFHGYNSTYLCLAFLQISNQIPPAKRKNLKGNNAY